ncbi:MAG TPA: cupin domain-containing protein, partial [Nevskia sp.]|nr:cupin domain-containing protein [Nevskia sp.]
MLDPSAEAVFAAVLRSHQLRATISSSASYCDNWTDPEPPCNHGTFHLLDRGECMVRSPALAQPLRLAAGDLVVFPHGDEHVLGHVADGAAGRFTSMLCGEFEFASGPRNPIVDALPG